MTKKCKTCNFWEPFNAVCFSAYSDERGDITDRNYGCDSWKPHECPQCGGLLEAKESEGEIWHVCQDCLREYLYNPYSEKQRYDPTDMSAGRDVSACGVFVDRNLIGELVDANGNVHYEDILKLPVLSCSTCEHYIEKWHNDKRYKHGGFWIVGCDQFHDDDTEFDFGVPGNFYSLWKMKDSKNRLD